MLRTTLLSLATVVGGVVAGCATGSPELQEPVVVVGSARCSGVAVLTGLDLTGLAIYARPAHRWVDPLGLRPLAEFDPKPTRLRHAELGITEPAAFDPNPARLLHADLGMAEPEAFATMEVRIHHAEVGVDSGNPVAFAEYPRIKNYRFDWEADRGVFAVVVEGGGHSVIRLYDAALSGGADLEAMTDPATGEPHDISDVRVCWGGDR